MSSTSRSSSSDTGAGPAGPRPRRLGDPRAWSDELLLTLARAGHRQAFGELYRRHRRTAELVAARRVRRADRDDVVASAFVAVFQALSNGAGPTDGFTRYLHTAVWTSSARIAKAGQREVPVDVTDRAVDRLTDAPRAGDAMALSAPMRAALANIDRGHAQVLMWAEVDGLSTADIAQRLGTTVGNAATRTYRARAALREAYRSMLAPVPVPEPGAPAGPVLSLAS